MQSCKSFAEYRVTTPSITLDHIFIITSPKAAEAERLIEFGFIEGRANIHPGQGTSNRRFFLNGITIELLYVHDSDEAANGAGRKLGILARTRHQNASPFGMVVRVSDEKALPPFPSWQYYPDYFHGKLSFYVGSNSDMLNEPLCVCMPPSLPKTPGLRREHKNYDWRFTALEIEVPTENPSPVLQQFAAMEQVQIKPGHAHAMTMQFNGGAAGKCVNLTPALPLVLEW